MQNSETVTIPLSRPIEHDGKQIASLTFREATVGDMCGADAVEGEFQKMVAVLSGMAGVSIPTMKQIPARDFARITEAVGHLMGESPSAAGSTSSPS